MAGNAIIRRLFVGGLFSLLGAGCASSLSFPRDNIVEHVPQVVRPRPIAEAETARLQEPASLEAALAIAIRYHPDLTAAVARVEAAQGRMLQAGLYPNPVLGPRFSELGESDNRTGQAGALFSQQFVTANKLGLAKAAAAHGVEAADWQAFTKSIEIITRARFAYFELLTALREKDTIEEIVGASAEAYKVATTLEKKGAGNRPDILRSHVELEQNKLKHEVALRRVDAARQNLVTALGRPPISLARLEKNRHDLEQAPPIYEWSAMLDCLRETSAELQEVRALIAQQEKLLAKARAEAIPDVNATVIPYYDSPTREPRVQAFVTTQLPIFNRNQGNIIAARADQARLYAEERQLELRLTEKLTTAYQRYQAARKQTEVYQQTIVPQARESLKLVGAGYRLGDPKYDYTALLQSQQVLFQAQLAQTQAMGELWRSVVEIAGVLQQEDLMVGCGIPLDSGTKGKAITDSQEQGSLPQTPE